MLVPRRLILIIALHLLVSAGVASAFAWAFQHDARSVAGHVLLLAEWDLAIVAVIVAVASLLRRDTWARPAFLVLMALTCSVQTYLYLLDGVSNVSWGRNITGHVVLAFAPTVWSGREQFPGGRLAARVFVIAPLLLMAATVWLSARRVELHVRWSRARTAVAGASLVVLFAGTLDAAVTYRDNLFWKDEPVASFFRPDGYAFEPSARRYAVEERDAVLRAAYPHRAAALHKHVILVIVDSLRADHMQVYGYPRPTTPFLSQLVQSGRMQKVDEAFSTCSESFCGITSTLSGREFRDISARTFQLQDVLRDEGYRTWFLLSGNHSAWNGLPQFYHAPDGAYFDGSDTKRYTMDDDRLVLEGLERVPPASASQPAFFYIHLMSTHYLGVQFTAPHFRTPHADAGSGLETYEELVKRVDTPDRYDDKVLQADGMIRELFEALAAKHYLDDAIVVITGDHGEGLGERHFAHGWNLYNEDIRIPMLIYDVPAAAAYPDLSFATQVDIAPTIVDRLGLPVPASWEGQSLLSPTRTRFTYHQTYFLPNRFAVLYRDGASLFKFIATPQYGKEELYDLVRDGAERRNLVAQDTGLAAILRDKVRAYRSDTP